MKNIFMHPLAAALILITISQAQQDPQPKPKTTQNQPCGEVLKSAPPTGQMQKQSAKLSARLGKIIAKTTHRNMDSTQAAPCPNAPPSAPAAQIPTTLKVEFASDDGKILYVCPPNTTKIDGWPWCDTPDKSLVEVIAIPVYSSKKPSQQATPAAPAAQN